MVIAMNSTRSFLSLLFATVVPIVLAPASRAGDDPTKKIGVCVLQVLATSQNKNVDEELKCLAKTVQEKDPSLTGFRLLKRLSAHKDLSVGDEVKFPLVDGKEVEVSIQKGPGKEDRIQLTVKPPTLRDVVYESCCGKYFPIVTRYETKDKERLILLICVHCCDKEKKAAQK
jgi:hypothetical protein